MSRPRKPFGAQQPGRLQATMMKVLAAEMSDPQRLRRGKQYAKDGSVIDIIIEAGAVTCEIQGSRSTPYIASLEVTSGDGMPLRRDVTARCTCPDDANSAAHACKHVLATMFVFADELLIEPDLLDVWRDNDRAQESTNDIEVDHDETPSSRTMRSVRSFDPDADDDAEANSLRRRRLSGRSTDDASEPGVFEAEGFEDGQDADDPDDGARGSSIGRRRRHLELVREGMEQGRAERREQQARRIREPHVDPIAHVLAFPDGFDLPDIGVIEDSAASLPKRPELASILRDAHRSLRLDWD